MNIPQQIRNIRETIPQGVTLVAVSKLHPTSMIQEAYQAGQRVFGESKVQEITEKQLILPKDIVWHFIGHLQTNKIKYIIPFVDLIESVDSLKLLLEIDKEAKKNGRVVRVLLQIHIAEEETKFGFSYDECREILQSETLNDCRNIQICGLMGMATFTDNEAQIHTEFSTLNRFFQEIKQSFFTGEDTFCELSMGMSDDYQIAIQEGSTIVRIGSKIFGVRI